MSTDALIESAQFEGFGRHLHEQRFLFLTANALGGILTVTAGQVAAFADHWPRLTLDRHMGDGGTYRYRRYGEFDAPPDAARTLLPHGPYEQPTYINGLNGGVSRLFDPLEPTFVTDPVFSRLLDWLTHLCDQCEGSPQHWNIRLHPYRIVAGLAQAGNPTPEGLHRDGVDYIVSMMVARCNVEGGQSTVTDNHRRVLWQRTLEKPLDIMIGQDALTMHAVTPVVPLDPALPAWRDVLVVAFTKVEA
ncbi:MAG: hypothetical protein RLY71_4705 [Pseudomonadota bacterium]|jgi:hypothetical protein